MSSSKTLRLLSTAYNFEENNVQIMVLKPSQDIRDGEGVIHSRAGLSRPCIMVERDINLYDLVKEYAKVLKSHLLDLKWVLVDECQFLSEKQVDELSDVVDYLHINVICYGLRTDFRTKLFEGSKRLFELADKIEEINSTCPCGERKTCFNARIDKNGKIITEGEQVLVGGDDTYKAVCRLCYKEMTKKLVDEEDY